MSEPQQEHLCDTLCDTVDDLSPCPECQFLEGGAVSFSVLSPVPMEGWHAGSAWCAAAGEQNQ